MCNGAWNLKLKVLTEVITEGRTEELLGINPPLNVINVKFVLGMDTCYFEKCEISSHKKRSGC